MLLWPCVTCFVPAECETIVNSAWFACESSPIRMSRRAKRSRSPSGANRVDPVRREMRSIERRRIVMISRLRCVAFSRHRCWVWETSRCGAAGRGPAARDLFHRRPGRRCDPDRDARARVDLDRLGLAGAGRPRSQAHRSRPQGPGRMRPPRSPGHDALAHGPLRRSGGARSDWCGSGSSGTGACPKTRMPRVTFPMARRPTIRWARPIARRARASERA